ncbi:hypothetical protein B0H67DRAFT_475015 [Lasiosphaeris hirsuta]|uniref:DUF7492 domain-containing protein n=1 Tax=Lasiosphaeris hirsuta TaxID=260670 RepID=A0AA40E7T4_9PEZI|nr:hypothetical protein B0H67DRAFT_475015 [Lasiosphaeris hirsuta]
MKARICSARGLLAAVLLGILKTATTHSWPEQIFYIASNGTMVGAPGYPRSHIPRGTKPENDIVWLLPPNGGPKAFLPDLKIARPDQRELKATSYTDEFPMLKVAPGDFVAIKYTENGHVSRPEITNPTKPVNRGTVYLYGTTENDLSNANLLDIHLKWTADGTGGDGKGKLLATRHFDDGQCFEAVPADGDTEGITNHRMGVFSRTTGVSMDGNQGIMCQSDLQIPLDAEVGKILTVIWVWDWPTMSEQGVAVPPASYPGNSSSSGEPYVDVPEIYTGVVDFDVISDDNAPAGNKKGVQYVQQRSPADAAIKAQMRKPFLVDVPQAGSGATVARAEAADIPMGRLVGVKAPTFPLNPSYLVEAPSAAQPAPTTVAPAAPVPTADGDDLLVIVTVTVPATTVFETIVRPTATGTGSPSPTRDVDVSPPGIKQFLSRPRARRVRRGAGAWNMNL